MQEELKQVLKERDVQAKDASAEAELTFLQLRQIQEELEHYFHHSLAQKDLLTKHQAQQQRSKELISKMLITNIKKS